MKIALVIDSPTGIDKGRVEAFARLFGLKDIRLFVVYNGGSDWAPLNQQGRLASLLDMTKRPSNVDCVLMHGGDYDNSISALKGQLVKSWTTGFIFNGPGDPLGKQDFIRILRSTNPFSLTEKHRDEIIQYVSDSVKGSPLPSCCYDATKHLIALDILAQGFLFTHGLLGISTLQTPIDDEVWSERREKTEDPEWWLKGLCVDTLEELKLELIEDHVAPANAERVIKILTKCSEAPLYDEKANKTTHPLQDVRKLISDLIQ